MSLITNHSFHFPTIVPTCLTSPVLEQPSVRRDAGGTGRDGQRQEVLAARVPDAEERTGAQDQEEIQRRKHRIQL